MELDSACQASVYFSLQAKPEKQNQNKKDAS